MKTNKQKALEALQSAGEGGIHSYDMRNIAGLQAPARIWQLIHQDGYNITTQAERRGNTVGVRYYLKEVV